jgi:type II secretory pathway pseudopilin PulG
MKIHLQSRSGMTLIEMAVTAGLVGVLGLIIYSLLNIGTILGAKNTATNTAHQQARVAMLEMIQHLHSAVSLPQMTDANGVPYPSPAPASAEGISFQQWGSAPLLVNGNWVVTPNGGPFKIIADTAAMPGSQNFVKIALPSASPLPVVNQRLIIPTHQIEGDITAVSARVPLSGSWDSLTITLASIPAPSPAPSPVASPGMLPVQIQGTTPGPTPSAAGDVICYITDRCSYRVVLASAGPPVVYTLQWTKTSDPASPRNIVTDITNPKPFSIPATPAGALYYRFVAAIDLSTSDPNYSNRGYKSANILLNGQVPYKARLTTYQ